MHMMHAHPILLISDIRYPISPISIIGQVSRVITLCNCNIHCNTSRSPSRSPCLRPSVARLSKKGNRYYVVGRRKRKPSKTHKRTHQPWGRRSRRRGSRASRRGDRWAEGRLRQWIWCVHLCKTFGAYPRILCAFLSFEFRHITIINRHLECAVIVVPTYSSLNRYDSADVSRYQLGRECKRPSFLTMPSWLSCFAHV